MSNGSAPRVALVVLDGWGYRPEREGNAIELAYTPTWHRLWRSCPRTLLEASGLAVGLPEGQMGNSEVGHLNLGAGRVVPQDLVRISQSIQNGEFYAIEPLVQLCAGLRQTGGTLHLVGLLGPGGVHALDRHLLACVELGDPAQGARHCHPWLSGWARFGPDAGRRGGSDPADGHARHRRQQGGHRHAHRPLLRNGPGPAVGAHQAGL